MSNTTDIKHDLIIEIEKRVTDKILEKANANLLIKLIKNADTADEAMDIATMGTIYKKTGLHFSPRLEPKRDNTIRYFKKNETLSFQTDKTRPTHKLIIGDNYPALQNLLIQYKGKVDVIYIDPPYGKDKMGEFAKTNYNNAITRDNLLSMLYPRLILARQLLSESGVIFCSIDDRNQAYIKCLFDEVFGEENFVANIVWASTGGSNTGDNMVSVTEYILMYSRTTDYNIKLLEKNQSNCTLEDEFINERGKYYLQKLDGKFTTEHYAPSLKYSIKYNNQEIWPGGDKNTKELWNWRWSKEKVEWGIQNKFIHFVEDKKDIKVYFKNYEKVDNSNNERKPSVPPKNVFIGTDKCTTSTGTIQLSKIFDINLFDFPKNTILIEYLLNLIQLPNNSVILDFFAGSGTTGQAVLNLNNEFSGNHTFILCQLNENLDDALKTTKTKKTIENQIAFCDKLNRPHELSEITADRLRRIMLGKSLDNSTDFEWIKKNTPYGDNLDVYDIASVADFENTKGKTPFDVIDETLYGKVKFKIKKEKIEWVCQNFDHTQKVLEE